MTTTINRRLMLGGVAAATIGGSSLALAQSRTGGAINQMHAGQALKGYDVVAYFSGAAAAGREDLTVERSGGVYRFANAQNRDAFLRSPARYEPQYGGFCAWGVANGKLFEIDPVAGWEVRDDKLFVFFNASILGLWRADPKALFGRAEQNWPRLNA
ncbi:MAG: YHS domain-containing (seleno)protein [Caulobacter sp.]